MTAVATVLVHRAVPGPRPVTAVPARAKASQRHGLFHRRPRVAGTLAAVTVGATAVVSGIDADLDPAAARRLVDLGFAPGATVEVLRRAPMADPTVFRVADTEIALRHMHAAAIHTASSARA